MGGGDGGDGAGGMKEKSGVIDWTEGMKSESEGVSV
jgi:hypothetical protein